MLYHSVLWLHILFAILAVGANATYGLLLGYARKEPAQLGFALRAVKLLDDRLANPCYALLLLSGLSLAFIGHIPFTTFWIEAALALYAVVLVLGLGVYSPTLRAQIAALDRFGPNAPEYQAISKRGTVVGIVVALVVLLILGFMVFKPTLG